MLHDDALWRTGRSRGVDHIGGVARVEGCGGRGRRLPRDHRPVGVEPHHVAAGRRYLGQPVEQGLLRDQHRRAGVREHE